MKPTAYQYNEQLRKLLSCSFIYSEYENVEPGKSGILHIQTKLGNKTESFSAATLTIDESVVDIVNHLPSKLTFPSAQRGFGKSNFLTQYKILKILENLIVHKDSIFEMMTIVRDDNFIIFEK